MCMRMGFVVFSISFSYSSHHPRVRFPVFILVSFVCYARMRGGRLAFQYAFGVATHKASQWPNLMGSAVQQRR